MKLIPAFGCLMHLVVRVALAADEPVNPDPGGIFDFSELDVPKEEEKKARETIEKEELQADVAYPEEVRNMLDRLTVYLMIQDEIIVRRTEPVRQQLQKSLLGLAEQNGGQVKADCLALATYVEGLPLTEQLRPEAILLPADTNATGDHWFRKDKSWNEFLPDGKIVEKWTPGTWRWVNKQKTILLVDYTQRGHADVVMLSTPAVTEARCFNNQGDHWVVKRKSQPLPPGRKPGTGGLRLVYQSAKEESAIREKAATDTARCRAGVARWLIHQSKSAPRDVSNKILMRAAELQAPPAARLIEWADLMSGLWLVEDGTRFELKPDGQVIFNGQPGKATWQWSKTRTRATALILFGKTGEATGAMFARRSNKEPGVLRVTTLDKALMARRQ